MSRKVLLIISGSVAAYKALELIRLLKKEGMEVSAILTSGGAEFITPLAVSSLTGKETYTDLFSLKDEVEMGHIRLSRAHDLIVVAPASAEMIAKMAQGRADDLASATLLATSAPVLVAPAMNHKMWEHPATQRNIRQIQADGAALIAPASGELACGEEGLGRMAEPEAILHYIKQRSGHPITRSSDHPLSGKRAIVTSGGTHEPIDPVRYLGNRSSGKQGRAIAKALVEAGAEVTLISASPCHAAPQGMKVIPVETAAEMLEATLAALPADIAICAAAVADWTPEQPAAQKLKKRADQSAPSLALKQTQDILATLANHPAKRPQLVIGFAAETEDMLASAVKKRAAKGCDWLLANEVADGKIFGEDTTQLTLITDAKQDVWPEMSKDQAAARLVEEIIQTLQETP